jgi:hypothetical protein
VVVAARGCRTSEGRLPPIGDVGKEVCFHNKSFEFIILITEYHFRAKRLPEKFTQFLVGHEPTGVNLQEASFVFCR